MSFNADHLMAARGLTYEGLQPYNPEHEAIATEMIQTVMPEDLGEAYKRLVFLADLVRDSDVPIDDCLHCWIGGNSTGFSKFKDAGTGAFRASDANETDPLLLGMRRIAMFDVPREIFAKEHGVWVYWLYAGVFVLSPRELTETDQAFRRHAYRLEWRLTGEIPKFERSTEDAQAYVLAHLKATASEGLEHIRKMLQQKHDLDIFNVPVNGPLFEPVTAWFGSLTGAELLRQELQLEERLVTYNCCGAAVPQPVNQASGKPSSVKQLQNQSPNRRDC